MYIGGCPLSKKRKLNTLFHRDYRCGVSFHKITIFVNNFYLQENRKVSNDIEANMKIVYELFGL